MEHINYQFHEMWLVAYCLYYPPYLDRINMDYIYTEGYEKLLKLALEIRPRDNCIIHSTVLIGSIDNNWLEYSITSYDVELIYKIVREFKNMTDKEIIENLAITNDVLSRREEEKLVLLNLEKAQELILEGKYRDGVNLAKSINVREPAKLELTTDLMKESVYTTNSFESGIQIIDKEFGGLVKGNIMNIAGDTGSMKTRMSVWMVMQILKKNPDFTCLYFEKEMPVNDITRSLVCNALKIQSSEILKAKESDKVSIIKRIVNHMLKEPEYESLLNRIKFVKNTHFNNAIEIMEFIDYHRPDVWVLDFLTMLGNTGKKDVADYYMFIVDQMKKLKDHVVANSNFAIILNQFKLNALSSKVNKIGDIGDIEYGSKINQFASYIYMTFYPRLYYANKYIGEQRRFYLVNKKGRDNKLLDIPFYAFPEHCEFNESILTAEADLKWLLDYKNPDSRKRKKDD